MMHFSWHGNLHARAPLIHREHGVVYDPMGLYDREVKRRETTGLHENQKFSSLTRTQHPTR